VVAGNIGNIMDRTAANMMMSLVRYGSGEGQLQLEGHLKVVGSTFQPEVCLNECHP